MLGDRVGSCQVLLAVIGPQWLDMLEARLGEPNDFLRIEIAEALQRKVRVVPVLIDGAKPPPAARLPDDLRALAKLNAVLVRADTFRSDLDQLIGFLREYLNGIPAGDQAAPHQGRRAEEYQRQGRIKIDARIIHGAPDGWFKPGAGKTEWFQDHEHGPEMVVAPAGSFMMGSPESEPERETAQGGTESPQHEVTLSRPFAVGRYPVTRGQFAKFVDDVAYQMKPGANAWKEDKWVFEEGLSWRNPGFAQDDDHPVVCVNWHDARAYAVWLSGKTGKVYRLPSEAERESVARATTTTPFWWGRSIAPTQANYDGSHIYEGGGEKGEHRRATVPVGLFVANPWGLYQVHGNVWEWCEDVWHGRYDGAPSDGAAWLQGADSRQRTVRGGSWDAGPWALRSAARMWSHENFRDVYQGFRLAQTL